MNDVLGQETLIISELKRLSSAVDNNTKVLTDHRIQTAREIATLKTRSKAWGAIWGAIAGIVCTMVTLVIQYWIFKI